MSTHTFSGNRDVWLNSFFQMIKNHFDSNNEYTSITAESLLDASNIDYSQGFVEKSGNKDFWITNIINPMLLNNDIDMISSDDVFNYLKDNNIISSQYMRTTSVGGKRRRKHTRKRRGKKTTRKRKKTTRKRRKTTKTTKRKKRKTKGIKRKN